MMRVTKKVRTSPFHAREDEIVTGLYYSFMYLDCMSLLSMEHLRVVCWSHSDQLRH